MRALSVTSIVAGLLCLAGFCLTLSGCIRPVSFEAGIPIPTTARAAQHDATPSRLEQRIGVLEYQVDALRGLLKHQEEHVLELEIQIEDLSGRIERCACSE